MPTPVPPRFRIGTAEPKDAFAAFEQRRLLAPSFRWEDVYQQEHAAGFAVAGVAQVDVLQLFQAGIDTALGSGGNLADFARAIKPQLVAKGWWGDVAITSPTTGEERITRFDDARLRLIYDVNLRQSYAAGRWARTERTRTAKPLLLYRSMRDERVRASHAQWDGTVLPIDHPFWRTHYAPNGWRCRCRCIAVSEADVNDYQADGIDIKRTPPLIGYTEFVNRSTGEVSRVPQGIDPGFAYNPGQVRQEQVATLQRRALDTTPPALATAVVQQLLGTPRFASFLRQPQALQALPVAVMPTADAAALGATSTTVMLADDTASRQAREHANVAPADYALLQQLLHSGQRAQDTPNQATYRLRLGASMWLATLQQVDGGLLLASLRTE